MMRVATTRRARLRERRTPTTMPMAQSHDKRRMRPCPVLRKENVRRRRSAGTKAFGRRGAYARACKEA